MDLPAREQTPQDQFYSQVIYNHLKMIRGWAGQEGSLKYFAESIIIIRDALKVILTYVLNKYRG